MLKKTNMLQVVSIVFIALLMISFSSMCLAAPKKITLRAVSAWPKTVFEVQNFMKFLEMVKENVATKYPGQLEIKYLGGPEVISNREQVEAVRNGLVDMVFTTDGYYVSVVPESNALSLTRIRPWEERERGVNDLMNKIHQKEVNAYYLGRIGSELPFIIYLTKPIKSVDDLKGMKIRCSPTHINFLKKVGAQPLVIPPPDVYTALERGLADGYIWVAGLIEDWGWNEVTKYVVDQPFYIAANVILINKDAWDKIPAHLQKLLIDTEVQAEHYAVERGEAKVKKGFESYKKQGIRFIQLPPADAKKFNDMAYSALWDVVIKKSPENGPKLKELVSK